VDPKFAPRSVVVIGAGIMGTSAALELARRGLEVTLLEKAIPGAEASSAAAGILGAEVENDERGPLLDLCRLGREVFGDWTRDLEQATGVDTGFLVEGSIELSSNPEATAARKVRRAFQLDEARGRTVDRTELEALEPGLNSSFKEGIFFPADAHVDPRQLFRATRIAAERAGVQVKSGTAVRALWLDSERDRPLCRGVILADGTKLEASATLAAAGSWTRFIDGLPLKENAVIPARGQVLELTSSKALLRGVVFGEGAYLVPRKDGRILVGSTLEFVGYHKSVTAGGMAQLLRAALALVPALESAEVTDSWSNFRPYTEDQRPLIGKVGVEGLWVASGHYRMGILLAPVTAQLIADLICRGRTEHDLTPFDPARFLPGPDRLKS
jgi:glycine oxidase